MSDTIKRYAVDGGDHFMVEQERSAEGLEGDVIITHFGSGVEHIIPAGPEADRVCTEMRGAIDTICGRHFEWPDNDEVEGIAAIRGR